MLPQTHRLTKQRDFQYVNKKGKTFFTHYFRLKAAPNNLAFSRFAFVVSTKISKKATERNSLKRKFREAVRLQVPHLKPGYDVIITAQASARGKTYAELAESVSLLLKKAGLYL